MATATHTKFAQVWKWFVLGYHSESRSIDTLQSKVRNAFDWERDTDFINTEWSQTMAPMKWKYAYSPNKRLAIQRTSTFDKGKVTSEVNLQIDCFYPMSLSNRSEWICSCVKLAVQDLANHWSLKMFCLLALPLSLLVCWWAESRVDWIWTKKWQDDATCSRQRVSVFGNGLQQIIRLVCIFALEHCQCGGGKHGEKQEEWWLNQSQVQILTPQPSNGWPIDTTPRPVKDIVPIRSIFRPFWSDNFWLTKTNCYIICRILRVTHKTKYQWLELEFRHLILFHVLLFTPTL